MRVKSLLLLLLLTFVSLSLNAQTNSLSIARSEYKKGNYEDAVVLFNGSIATTYDQSTKAQIEKERELSSKCWEYLDKANSAYSQKRYDDAKKLYSAILGINKYDSNSSYKVKQCNTMINNAADNEYWAKVVASKNADEYANYIKTYPSGLHIAEAKKVMSNVSYDKGLWDKAVAQNTKSAYQNYLTNSKYNWHKEEAQSKVDYFTDQELWAAAKKTNTKAAYTSYLSTSKVKPAYVSYANAMIALFNARSQYSAKQYLNARLSFESHKKVYSTLSSSDQQLYSKCCEESDYTSFFTSSASSRRNKGNTFLTLYPKSTYVRRVKSWMSRSYADSRNYSEASLYAQSDADRKYITEKQRAQKKASRNRTEYAIGFGNDWDFAKNSYSYSVPVYFSFGSYDNLFNFKIGAQYKRITGSNTDSGVNINGSLGENEDGRILFEFDDDHQPHLIANQVSIPASFRFNFGYKRNACQFFMEFGGSYNYNFSGTYKRYGFYDAKADDGGGVDKFSNSETSLLNKFNVSSIGKVGLVINDYKSDMWWDLALVVRYDISPVFNVDAINTNLDYNNSGYLINFYNSYESIRNQVDNKLYIGFSLGINFEL